MFSGKQRARTRQSYRSTELLYTFGQSSKTVFVRSSSLQPYIDPIGQFPVRRVPLAPLFFGLNLQRCCGTVAVCHCIIGTH